MACNIIYFLLLPSVFISYIQLQFVQSTLNPPLDNLFIYSQKISGEILVGSENCTLAFEKFSKALLNFTNCSIEYARPIHMCMNCEKSLTALNSTYQYLKNQGPNCQSYFFSSDQLSVLDILYKNGNDLWQERFCQSCIDNYNETEKFFQASNELVNCMETANVTSSVAGNNTCTKCQDVYANLSSSYKKFVQPKNEFVFGICMDIVDTMIMLQKAWGEANCIVIPKHTVNFPSILTALTIGLTPLMFYLLAKNVSHLEDIKLVRPKRKSTVVPSTHAVQG